MNIKIKFNINISKDNEISSEPTIFLPASISKEKRELLVSEISNLNEKLLKTIVNVVI